jgi:hypothetical protein
MNEPKCDYAIRMKYGVLADLPDRPGSIALEISVLGEEHKDREIRNGKRRNEIGQIEVQKLKPLGDWEIVYTQEYSKINSNLF